MTFQGNRPLRVFLSHAAEDKSAVQALRRLLARENVDVWLADERILPGQTWESEIRKALNQADVIIICLSKNLVNKAGYFQKELKMALRKSDEMPEDAIYLIPLKLEECDTPSSFEHLQWVNMFFQNGGFDTSILDRVMLALRRRAESLGILWSALFPNPEPPVFTPAPNNKVENIEAPELRRTIQIGSEPRAHVVNERKPVESAKSSLEARPSIVVTRKAAAEELSQDIVTSLVVYLIDVSATMGKPLKGSRTRLDFVRNALQEAIDVMVDRSRAVDAALKYKVAVYTYSDDVVDVLSGPQPIDILAKNGLPRIALKSRSDTARAFSAVEELFQREFYRLRESPAPFLCHITDGKFTGESPVPIAKRILEMSVGMGNPIIENIYICDDLLAKPIEDIKGWPGITSKSDLRNDYAHALYDMSSTIPERYHAVLAEHGFQISRDAKLLIPGEYAKDFIRLVLP